MLTSWVSSPASGLLRFASGFHSVSSSNLATTNAAGASLFLLEPGLVILLPALAALVVLATIPVLPADVADRIQGDRSSFEFGADVCGPHGLRSRAARDSSKASPSQVISHIAGLR